MSILMKKSTCTIKTNKNTYKFVDFQFYYRLEAGQHQIYILIDIQPNWGHLVAFNFEEKNSKISQRGGGKKILTFPEFQKFPKNGGGSERLGKIPKKSRIFDWKASLRRYNKLKVSQPLFWRGKNL